MRGLAEAGVFNIVAHIDLPKKFGYMPSHVPQREIDAALDAIAEAGLVVELNTAGWHKPCADAYPSTDIVGACFARNIPVTISADAHQGDHLLRDFENAARRLQDAGYDRVARFANREMRFEAISQAL